ncbi:DNA repair protein RadC [Robiginitalea sp. M366]|uniref:RadC family protein n=1 Tax=Robiginitalea aestuariiviva TaxID=3036903 RepID=UPI00240D2651|nr:DNA repair protein RadC [Robiginitalea aestuariiviva]MDG1572081.1 DNA repair protein RadC [Robiginitalea aestuariiviva]
MKHKETKLAECLPMAADRPRERLLAMGPGALTDAELLALIIGSGTVGATALDLARALLKDNGSHFRGVAALQPEGLQRYRGIGTARAVNILAALEIGKRYALVPEDRKGPIRESGDAYRLLKPALALLEHEEFWVMYLNNANRVLYSGQLSKGGLTGTLVDVRLILKRALELGAVGLILAHNHPSGKLRPSKADQNLTRKVFKAAATMDIRVLDHLICSDAGYFSFADEQML